MIPWREQPTRLPALEYVQRWYRHNLGIEPILCDTDYVEFNRAGARNECVRQATEEVIVICDADTIPELASLEAAVHQVLTDRQAQLPFTVYRNLVGVSTKSALRGVHPRSLRGFDMKNSVGGVMVTTRDIWERHGGQDERFTGWGYEDAAWYMAHETLLGAPRRHDGFIYSLTHDLGERDERTQQIGIDLVERYKASRHDIDAMTRLVFTERGLSSPRFNGNTE